MTIRELTRKSPALSPLLARVAECGTAAVIVIDGGAGAGKTTLAGQLGTALCANVYHTDDYFLPPARKTPARLRQPGGNLDYERMAEEITRPLSRGAPVRWRRYDCKTGILGAYHEPPSGRISILEGVYSLHPELVIPGAIRVLLTVDPDLQRARLLARSGAELLARYEREWLPLERLYFETYAPRAEFVLSL